MKLTVRQLRVLIREAVEEAMHEGDDVSAARQGFDLLRKAANAFQTGGFSDTASGMDAFASELRGSPELKKVAGKIEEADALKGIDEDY